MCSSGGLTSETSRLWATPATFIRRALAAEGHWPLPELDGIDLTTTPAVLRSAARLAPMVSVYYEKDDPDDCRIGVPHSFKRHGFRLQLVTTAAEWDFSTTFRYRRVSRIGIGGSYQDRLAAIAGAAPDPQHGNATYKDAACRCQDSRPRLKKLKRATA